MIVAGAPADLLGVPPFQRGPWIEATNLMGVARIASSQFNSLAVLNDGTLWVTGDGHFGSLGTGGNDRIDLWTRIASMSDVKWVAASGSASYAVTGTGQLWLTGSAVGLEPPAGQVSHYQWAPVPGMTDVRLVDTVRGSSFGGALALKGDGTVWAAGVNLYGSLGFGDEWEIRSWRQIPGLSGVVDISGGFNFSLALKADGTLWATGGNPASATVSSFGGAPRRTFAEVLGISNVKSIAAGPHCSMVITGDRSLWVTGSGGSAFGLGSGAPSSVVGWIRVPNLTGVKAVTTNCRWSLAIKSDGTLWVAGDNYNYGQLGMGSPYPATLSVWTQVPGQSGF